MTQPAVRLYRDTTLTARYALDRTMKEHFVYILRCSDGKYYTGALIG